MINIKKEPTLVFVSLVYFVYILVKIALNQYIHFEWAIFQYIMVLLAWGHKNLQFSFLIFNSGVMFCLYFKVINKHMEDFLNFWIYIILIAAILKNLSLLARMLKKDYKEENQIH